MHYVVHSTVAMGITKMSFSFCLSQRSELMCISHKLIYPYLPLTNIF